MRTAGAFGAVGQLGLKAARRRRPAPRFRARLHALRLDRELAGGIEPWSSPLHASRALQLTEERRRRSLARSLEQLCEIVERPRSPRRGAVIPLCREQVQEARPLIMAITARLRSGEPLDARGVARLQALLSDGNGPCYVSSRPNALTEALQAASQWLRTAD